ncbi:SAM-dependent methyltransferase [Streptomyces canus]|uniref:SAM-dependent methyltransferase n=1 Tax=Streptomyces canus TaxID=58343 RepID=UPI003719842D
MGSVPPDWPTWNRSPCRTSRSRYCRPTPSLPYGSRGGRRGRDRSGRTSVADPADPGRAHRRRRSRRLHHLPGPRACPSRPAPARLRQPGRGRARRVRAPARPRGRRVAVVSGGDPGVFAMATAVLETASAKEHADIPVQVMPA